MAKSLASNLKKVLIALRWKPRRPSSHNAPNGASDLKATPKTLENDIDGEGSEADEKRPCDEDTAPEDGLPECREERVEAGVDVEAASAGGPSERSKRIKQLVGAKDEVTAEDFPEGLTSDETRRLNRLSERARRFSLPLILSRRSSTKDGKGKGKAVVDAKCDTLEEEQTPPPFGGMSLADLPFDVLFTLMSIADISTVYPLSQVRNKTSLFTFKIKLIICYSDM